MGFFLEYLHQKGYVYCPPPPNPSFITQPVICMKASFQGFFSFKSEGFTFLKSIGQSEPAAPMMNTQPWMKPG
jgi:hypothetical protein